MTPHFSDAPLACVKRDSDSSGAISRLLTPRKIVLPVFLIGRFGRIHLPQSRVELDRSFCLPDNRERIEDDAAKLLVYCRARFGHQAWTVRAHYPLQACGPVSPTQWCGRRAGRPLRPSTCFIVPRTVDRWSCAVYVPWFGIRWQW